MTREEAISMIEDDIRLHHKYLSGKYRKALRVAISALEQPEIIHCRSCEKYGTKFCAMDIWTDQVMIRRVKPNDFCSKAERKKE